MGYYFDFQPIQTNVWFGGKLISKMNSFGYLASVVRDRLQSDRETGAQYYPYGDEITSAANGTEKYGTYVRDSFTTMDYADLRYYVASYGRFNTADRTASSAMSPNPASWNRYSYALGDQVNSSDPKPFLFLAASDDLRVNHRRQIAGVLMLTNDALSNPSAFIRSMTWNQSSPVSTSRCCPVNFGFVSSATARYPSATSWAEPAIFKWWLIAARQPVRLDSLRLFPRFLTRLHRPRVNNQIMTATVRKNGGRESALE